MAADGEVFEGTPEPPSKSVGTNRMGYYLPQ